MRQGAQGWCTGMDLRDGMGREVGGGRSGWGTHVPPLLIHVNLWQKQPQYCKVISLQLKKKRLMLLFCSSSLNLVGRRESLTPRFRGGLNM